MDKLDALLAWASNLDRSAQFEVINRLCAISPNGLIMVPGTVNDPEQSPAGVVIGFLIRRALTPLKREGVWLVLTAWLDVVMQEDGMTFSEQMVDAPLRAASGSAAPVTDEVMAQAMSFRLMSAARSSKHWSEAVQSWKEFRRGPA